MKLKIIRQHKFNSIIVQIQKPVVDHHYPDNATNRQPSDILLEFTYLFEVCFQLSKFRSIINK